MLPIVSWGIVLPTSLYILGIVVAIVHYLMGGSEKEDTENLKVLEKSVCRGDEDL